MNAFQVSVEFTTTRPTQDIDLEHRIANFLLQQHVPCCEKIRTHAQAGTVIVKGKLPSRYAKWLCVKCCCRVAGVVKLVDRVAVD